jgi:hypothetical protein
LLIATPAITEGGVINGIVVVRDTYNDVPGIQFTNLDKAARIFLRKSSTDSSAFIVFPVTPIYLSPDMANTLAGTRRRIHWLVAALATTELLVNFNIEKLGIHGSIRGASCFANHPADCDVSSPP